MNITIVLGDKIPSIKYGGTQRVMWYLGKELNKRGHKVTFIAGKGSSCPFTKVIELDPSVNVAQKFSIHRLCDKEGKHNLANRFVGELMEQLVQDGLLVTTKTRNGLGVRTATDAEISSPLPGQQQMTL